jgi:hypothetical protein
MPKVLFRQPVRHADLKRSQRTLEVGILMVRNISRVTGWLVLAAIIVLSLVPPGARPTTFLPHKIEHAGIFLLDGVAFGIAYCGYDRLLSIGAVIFCATIELAQLAVPGRHARLSDFFVDAIAIYVGVIAGSALNRTGHYLPSGQVKRLRQPNH